jgi:serine/threonine protein kinase
MAPEILNYLDASAASSEYTNAVDLWAVGCIVYRLITGVIPFPPGTSLVKYCQDKSSFPYDALFDSGIKSDGSKFIRQLLATDPKVRPSASQALQHQWIISSGSESHLILPPNHMQTMPLGSNTGSGSSDISRQSQETSRPSEPTGFEIGYNTASHDGLKSYRSFSPSNTTSSHSKSSTQTSSSSNTHLPSVSGYSTITRKSLPISKSETTVNQPNDNNNNQSKTTPDAETTVKPALGNDNKSKATILQPLVPLTSPYLVPLSEPFEQPRAQRNNQLDERYIHYLRSSSFWLLTMSQEICRHFPCRLSR